VDLAAVPEVCAHVLYGKGVKKLKMCPEKKLTRTSLNKVCPNIRDY